ncbi:MAG: AMP-binding protein [Legionellales bacterium]|nr:AMP-binding protein [Legionellales bacterium]
MDKIWLTEYQQGVPHETKSENYNSIGDLFDQKCEKFSELTAFSNFGTDITFEELHKLSLAFAAYLQNELKLKKGDKFAIMSPNLLQYPVAIFGALKAGLTVVNINPLYTPRELLYQVNDADIETILVLENFAVTVQKIIGQSSLKNIIVTKLGDLHSYPKNIFMNFINKFIKKNIQNYTISNCIYFSETIKKGKFINFTDPNIQPKNNAFMEVTVNGFSLSNI